MTMSIGYTEHAFKRMTERGISRATVEAVIRCGDVERVEDGGKRRYALFGMIVVVDGENVVTVFSNGKQKSRWSPKKRQRKRRLDLKPSYIEGRGKINIKLQREYYRQMEAGR